MLPVAGAQAANPVVASARIDITDFGSYLTVCPRGDASFVPLVNGQWRLQFLGARSTNTVIQGSAATSGVATWNPTTSTCPRVYKNAAAAGQFNATLDYVGGGGDVAGHAEAVGAWGTAASLLMLVNTGT